MENEMPNAMNLDLNLGPVDQSNNETESELHSFTHEAINLEDWLGGPVNRIRQAVRQRRQRWRSVWRQLQVPPEARNIALEFTVGSDLQVGEGSVAVEESASVECKICDNNIGFLGDEVFGKKDEEGKRNATVGSGFDCNICLDLAKDPVVTCCGHLFCWACLYRWLHLHSDAMECPVCKGEVMLKNVTPIFGRGNFDCQPEDDINLKIPPRPQARRFDSWRQAFQRSAFSIPVEEMIRSLDNRFDLSHVQPPNAVAPSGSPERSNTLLDRILTSRRMQREQNIVISPGDVVDLIQNSVTNSNNDGGESHQIPSILLRRSNSSRAATISHLTSALSSAERLVESYFRSQPVVVRNQDHPQAVEDRDSMSSIAAVIQSESQTVDTAIEIDSTVSLSTSSSRRRNDASRISDVDSGDSRAPRRRRLN